ncbi:efflux RND transporter periplasmic adaptor subunit [uncultured Anaeromusa sp.]|uniref:efflux RND transporter periplasmic adaptor subunit n=1 Tax=uncultured Anaeromusa sp. TaxID=673273 RepID=UPI0029C876A1|nr:efflux RND transporter periplasmic adaptor subunit [uncultured Anaeromusa sp.]
MNTRSYAAALLAALVFLGGCGAKQEVSDNKVAVKVESVGASNQLASGLYAGEVKGRKESQLSFRVAGKIQERLVDAGARVSLGDPLFRLEPSDLTLSLERAASGVAGAEADLKLAQRNLERSRELYEQQAISRQAYDTQVAQYEAAEAKARSATAAYGEGGNQLSYSVLTADRAGVVSAVSGEVGQVVSAGQAVLTLVGDGEKEVEFAVPENRVQELFPGKPVQVSFWALPGMVVSGNIREVTPQADPVTRTYKVRVSLVQPSEQVYLGMSASVAMEAGAVQALRIPLAAVYQSDGQSGVWVVQDEKVHFRPIRLGEYGKNDVVVLEGLAAQETIVVAGVQKLSEGQGVRIWEGGGR